jgi:hypothetical protein
MSVKTAATLFGEADLHEQYPYNVSLKERFTVVLAKFLSAVVDT